MLEKVSILKHASKSQLVTELVTSDLQLLQAENSRYNAIAQKQINERKLYNLPSAILNGKLKGKYNNSGDKTYKALQAALNSTLQYLFCDHSVNSKRIDKTSGETIYTVLSAIAVKRENALKAVKYDIERKYSVKIDKATASGKTYIYRISAKHLRNMFKAYIKTDCNNNTIGHTVEVLHDLFVFLLESGIDIEKYLTMDFQSIQGVFSRIFYKSIVTNYRLHNKKGEIYTFNRTSGVYRTQADGSLKCIYNYKSHLFNVGKSDGLFINDIGIISQDGKNLTVYKFKSLWDILSDICNAYIAAERRNFTSKESYEEKAETSGNEVASERNEDENEVDLDTQFSYSDNGLVNCEKADLFAAMYNDLIANRVQKLTARRFINFMILLLQGFTQEEGEKITGLNRKYFIALTQTHYTLIHKYLPKVFIESTKTYKGKKVYPLSGKN